MRPVLAGLAAVALCALTLTACTSVATPPITPPVIASVSPSTDPGSGPAESSPPATTAPTSSAEITSIPTCEALVDLGFVRAATGSDRVEGPEARDLQLAESLPGPAARSAYATATATRGCGYGIPYSDGGLYVAVALLTQPVADGLVAALSASSEFTRSTSGDIVRFDTANDGGLGSHLAYAFHGDVWAIVEGTMVDSQSSTAIASEAIQVVVPNSGGE